MIEFSNEQIDRLGHWLSECLDDAAPLNEKVWRSRAEWMVKGPTFQRVIAEVVDHRSIHLHNIIHGLKDSLSVVAKYRERYRNRVLKLEYDIRELADEWAKAGEPRELPIDFKLINCAARLRALVEGASRE